jgi:RNA polymerase sigma-70 factor (ECF subfamily)
VDRTGDERNRWTGHLGYISAAASAPARDSGSARKMLGTDDNRGERDSADLAALERLRAGDPGAIADLYDRYRRTALGLALKIVRDAEEAEDVVHDAFTTIVERAHQYQPDRGSVAAWLLTTVRNLSLDRTRRRVRRAIISELELRPETLVKHGPGTDPEEQLSLERQRSAVRSAMGGLPEAQRNTLLVAFFEGLSYPEMAERDNIPLGTIKSRAARAIHALRSSLEAQGWELSAEAPYDTMVHDEGSEPMALAGSPLRAPVDPGSTAFKATKR